jgi:enolase
MDVADQVALDKLLVEIDGTNDRSRLGSNALLAVSAACARAGAMVRGIELWEHLAMARPASLPLPMANLFSGNLHASGGMSIQDILIVPYAAPDEVTAIEWACDVYFAAKSLLIERSASTLVGDEGGFGAPSTSSESALALAVESIIRAGHDPSTEVGIALDIAASHKSHLDGGANESREGPYARQTRPHFRPHISPTPQDQTDTEQHVFLKSNDMRNETDTRQPMESFS